MGVSVCTLKFDVAIAPGYAECLVEMWEPSETTPSFDEGATPSSYSLSWDGEHSARLQTRSNNSGINEDDTQRPLLPMSTPALAPGNRLCGWPSWVPCSLALSPRPQAGVRNGHEQCALGSLSGMRFCAVRVFPGPAGSDGSRESHSNPGTWPRKGSDCDLGYLVISGVGKKGTQ